MSLEIAINEIWWLTQPAQLFFMAFINNWMQFTIQDILSACAKIINPNHHWQTSSGVSHLQPRHSPCAKLSNFVFTNTQTPNKLFPGYGIVWPCENVWKIYLRSFVKVVVIWRIAGIVGKPGSCKITVLYNRDQSVMLRYRWQRP